MEELYKPPHILRLVGITLNDHVTIEDVADDRLLEQLPECSETSVGIYETDMPFDKIPPTFTGLEDWPLHTNLRCWNCNFTFDDRPKFVPPFVRETEDGKVEFGVHGNMCTFNCAMAWILTNYATNSDQQCRARNNLFLLYFVFTGVLVSHIRPSESCTKLKQYGGELDEDVYWKRMRDLDPIAGLRDHTLGSIIPERERGPAVLSILRDASCARPINVLTMDVLVEKLSNVWGVCTAGRKPAQPARYESPLVDIPRLALKEMPTAGALNVPGKKNGTTASAASATKTAVTPAKTTTTPVSTASATGTASTASMSKAAPANTASMASPVTTASTMSVPKSATAKTAPSTAAKTGAAPKTAKTVTAPAKTATAPAKTATAPTKTATAPARTTTAPAKTATTPASAATATAKVNPASGPVDAPKVGADAVTVEQSIESMFGEFSELLEGCL
jgi:hypothetical protein